MMIHRLTFIFLVLFLIISFLIGKYNKINENLSNTFKKYNETNERLSKILKYKSEMDTTKYEPIYPDTLYPGLYYIDSFFIKVYIRNKNIIEYTIEEWEYENGGGWYMGDYEPWTIGKYIDEITLKGLWWNKIHYSPHLIDSVGLDTKRIYIKTGTIEWW